MKPDFEAMNRQELKRYILAHRNDAEAISAYVTKISAEPGWVTYPAPSSPKDLDNYPEFLEKVRRDGQLELSTIALLPHSLGDHSSPSKFGAIAHVKLLMRSDM